MFHVNAAWALSAATYTFSAAVRTGLILQAKHHISLCTVLNQRCADPEILSPRQSMDFDQT